MNYIFSYFNRNFCIFLAQGLDFSFFIIIFAAGF